MPSWLVTLIGIVFTGLVGGSFLSYILERTRKKAQGLVATKTIDTMVDAAELTNEAARMQLIEDRLELIDEANRQERESLVRTIGNLRAGIERVEVELMDMTRRHRIAIAYIRVLLAHINDHGDGDPTPLIPDGLDLNA